MIRLLVVGDDRLGRRLVHELGERAGLHVVVDRSSSLRRVGRLVRRRVISPAALARMALAEWLRPRAPAVAAEEIRSNDDLIRIIERVRPAEVYLFRAGLIINRRVLSLGVPVLNLHCARIPEYGGLGSIGRALKDGALDQAATLHRVTDRIDQGEVLAELPYRLQPRRPYHVNEGVAYRAGMDLLARVLGGG